MHSSPPAPLRRKGGESFDPAKYAPGYLTGNSYAIHIRVQLAKSNRKDSTEAERILWECLRNRKLTEKFRRQHPVGNYIPDFACLEKRLIIEVDGEYHSTKEQIELDEMRSFELEQKHLFKVMRFTNEEVLTDIENVLRRIKIVLSER